LQNRFLQEVTPGGALKKNGRSGLIGAELRQVFDKKRPKKWAFLKVDMHGERISGSP